MEHETEIEIAMMKAKEDAVQFGFCETGIRGDYEFGEMLAALHGYAKDHQGSQRIRNAAAGLISAIHALSRGEEEY